MPTDTDTTIAYTTNGSVRRCCGHLHRTWEAAAACIKADDAGCKQHSGPMAYSDRAVVPVTQQEALARTPIPWALLRAAGADLGAIASDAQAAGDDDLYRRARAAARR